MKEQEQTLLKQATTAHGETAAQLKATEVKLEEAKSVADQWEEAMLTEHYDAEHDTYKRHTHEQWKKEVDKWKKEINRLEVHEQGVSDKRLRRIRSSKLQPCGVDNRYCSWTILQFGSISRWLRINAKRRYRNASNLLQAILYYSKSRLIDKEMSRCESVCSIKYRAWKDCII
jgi:hypothetical protein